MYVTIDQLRDAYTVKDLCEYFDVPRSSYYRWVENERPLYKHWNEWLAQKIKELFISTQKGYRYITYQLKRKYDFIVNRKTVLRYMQILGFKSPIRKKRFIGCTQREVNEKARNVHNNVLARQFKAIRPFT